MKTGSNSDNQFEESGDIHDAVNAESSVAAKYSSPAQKIYREIDPVNDDQPDRKNYGMPNIPISSDTIKNPIPEYITTNPPPPKPKEEAKLPPKEPIKPVMPDVAQLPTKEKELAADKAVQMTLMGYKTLHQAANWGVRINEGSLKKLEKKKLINLKVPFPTEIGQVPVIAVIQEYNEEVGGVFTVSQEFEDEVTPILKRMFNKHSIGVSDEYLLMGIVAKDLVVKGAQFVELRKGRRDLINTLKDLTVAYKNGHPIMATPQATPQPQQNNNQEPQYQAPTPQQPVQPQPAYQQPPTPPRFEEDVEVAEIIPNDVDGELIDVIPEPPDYPQQHDITEFQEEVKTKRAYKKKEPTDVSIVKKAAHRPKGKRNKID